MTDNKLYVLTYHEVQIAGYRVLNSYDIALKEYLKHCILETKELIEEDKEEQSETESFDDMTCIFEIQELQDNEYNTIKEYDYDFFQQLLDEVEDIPAFLDMLDKKLDANEIPQNILDLFKS